MAETMFISMFGGKQLNAKVTQLVQHFYFICVTVNAERCDRCHSQGVRLPLSRGVSFESKNINSNTFSVEMHMAVLAIITTSKEHVILT